MTITSATRGRKPAARQLKSPLAVHNGDTPLRDAPAPAEEAAVDSIDDLLEVTGGAKALDFGWGNPGRDRGMLDARPHAERHGQIGPPAETAGDVAYLTSDYAAYISGTIIRVDRGPAGTAWRSVNQITKTLHLIFQM
jgi:NAD(P)-dependent dehydrogenase (short-subunit alcohol dehydrogenase family)